MLKKTIKYTDYNGVERTEDFYFNLTMAELTKMNLGITGGLANLLKQIIMAQDTPAIISLIEDLLQRSYGVKTNDGKGFRKTKETLDDFMATEAYSILFMELATDDVKAANFVKGIIPADLAQKVDALPTASLMQNITDTSETATN